MACCGVPPPPEPPAGPVTWEGPTTLVGSAGVTIHDRREIAQKVAFPTCIRVGDDRYLFSRVTTTPGSSATPPGLFDSMYRFDRWRLWSQPGVVIGQPTLYVTARGSTGILAEYERAAPGAPCG